MSFKCTGLRPKKIMNTYKYVFISMYLLLQAKPVRIRIICVNDIGRFMIVSKIKLSYTEFISPFHLRN